jgi:REP element-mobilizing transposase RayT
MMVFLVDEIYHIYNRGNNKQRIFLEAESYRFFLERLQFYFHRESIELLAYCLMPNHYHLLVRPRKEINFSTVMQSFTTSFVMSMNQWYARSGHLFQGRFRPKLVDAEEYLLHLCRYIHLNPVTAGLVSLPEDWRYSDYGQWISAASSSSVPWVLLRNELFGSGAEYKKFVMDFAEAQKKETMIEKYLFE